MSLVLNNWAQALNKAKIYVGILGSCANTLLTFLGYQESVLTSRNVCDVNRHRRSKLWTIARNMTKALVAKGIPVKHMSIGDRLYANATVMIVSEVPTAFSNKQI